MSLKPKRATFCNCHFHVTFWAGSSVNLIQSVSTVSKLNSCCARKDFHLPRCFWINLAGLTCTVNLAEYLEIMSTSVQRVLMKPNALSSQPQGLNCTEIRCDQASLCGWMQQCWEALCHMESPLLAAHPLHPKSRQNQRDRVSVVVWKSLPNRRRSFTPKKVAVQTINSPSVERVSTAPV